MTAFVDWKAQMHNAGVGNVEPREGTKRALERTGRIVGRSLVQHAPARFHVVFRFYHGWHKGWEPTENLRAMKATVNDTDFSVLAQAPNVVCSPAVEYGHTLLSAMPERTHAGSGIHLPNTWRRQARHASRTEKMVDTALAADLLAWARSDPQEWALVLSEDDDVVPPVFTAEAWTRPHGGRAFIVRTRPPDGFLKLDGLLMNVSR